MTPYLGYKLIFARSAKQAVADTQKVMSVLQTVGWLMNVEKSSIEPAQVQVYLGYKIDRFQSKETFSPRGKGGKSGLGGGKCLFSSSVFLETDHEDFGSDDSLYPSCRVGQIALMTPPIFPLALLEQETRVPRRKNYALPASNIPKMVDSSQKSEGRDDFGVKSNPERSPRMQVPRGGELILNELMPRAPGIYR